MSQKHRDKQEKRRRRLERRAQNDARRGERKEREESDLEASKVLCPNCDTRYLPGDKAPIHRDGPCDCDSETRRLMGELIDARGNEFEAARKLVRDPVSNTAVTENPGAFSGPVGGLGLVACRSCSCLHNEDQQATMFIEGRLVWDGCDYCLVSRNALVEYAINQARTRWGWRPSDAVVGGVDPKFVPPPQVVQEHGLVLAMPKKVAAT